LRWGFMLGMSPGMSISKPWNFYQRPVDIFYVGIFLISDVTIFCKLFTDIR